MKRYYQDAFGKDVLSSQIVSLNGNTVILTNGLRHTMDSEVADEIAAAIQDEMAAYPYKSPNLIRHQIVDRL